MALNESAWNPYTKRLLLVIMFITALGIGFAVVGEGGSGAQPTRTAVTPLPSPTPTSNFAPEYKLEPDRQVLLRAAWYDLTASERANICAFMTEVPQDAIAQAVREGFPKRDARHVVKFVVGEMC